MGDIARAKERPKKFNLGNTKITICDDFMFETEKERREVVRQVERIASRNYARIYSKAYKKDIG